METSMDAARRVLARHRRALASLPNVIGVGVGHKCVAGKDTGIPAIVVLVSSKVSERLLPPAGIIPKEIEGIPTDVVESGEVRLL